MEDMTEEEMLEMINFINGMSEKEFKKVLDDTEKEIFGGKTLEEISKEV